MKLQLILTKANNILKYLRTRRRRRLYRQWIEMAGLPPEAIPEEELARETIPQIEGKQLHLPLLYMLLGASLLILCVGLILLLIHSC